MAKKCSTCQKEKGYELFHRNKSTATGYANSCKPCSSNHNKAHYAKNGERLRLNIKEYREQNKDACRRRSDRWGKENPGKMKASMEKYKINNRKVINAHASVYRAIKSGQITKPSRCEGCAEIKPLQGHHSDYNLPLSIQWLCHGCHSDWHKRNGKAKNRDN